MRRFVLACVLLGGMGQGVVSPRMPELLSGSTRLAVDSGLSAALMYLGVFASTFWYGRAADRGRAHWLLAPGLLAYAVILLGMGFCSGSMSAVFTLRFFEGLALAAIYVAADFAIGRLSPDGERARWLSLYGVALSVGLVLGPLLSLGTPRIAGALGAPPSVAAAPLLPLAIVAAFAVGLALFAWRHRVPTAAEAAGTPVALDLRPLVAGGAYGFMEASLVAVFPALAIRALHVAPENCLLTSILCAATCSFAWGAAADRAGARRVTLTLVAMLAVAPAALALAFAGPGATPATQAYVSSALFGVLAGGLYPVGFAWLLERVPERQYGQASGAFARAYGIGSLAGPLAAGFAAEKAGLAGLLLTLSAAGVVAGIAIGLSRLRLFAFLTRRAPTALKH